MPFFMHLNPLLFLLQSNLLPFSICQPREPVSDMR